MVTAIARRVFLRPKIDEECPDWARALIPCLEQEHGLGIPYEKIPQATLEALHFFFPAPVPRKCQRDDMAGSARPKYARTCGLTVFLACLPYACAKQLDLFSAANGTDATGEVAVLGIRSLADLARKVGMSYDRIQRWMTVLITLGFIWRFRDGKKTLYVIPLTVYVPRPSAEAVRNTLTALIYSQFAEFEQDEGEAVRANRNPEFTNLLLETRAKFEQRYQLAPSLDLAVVDDPTWEQALLDIQQALPGFKRSDLYTILPIVTRQLLRQGDRTGKGRHFVLKHSTVESTLSNEPSSHAQSGEPSPAGIQESRLTVSGSGARQNSTPARSHKPGTHQQRGAKGLTAQEEGMAAARLHIPTETSSLLPDDLAAAETNAPVQDGLQRGCVPSALLTQGGQGQDESAAAGLGRSATQEGSPTAAEEIARVLDDQKSLKFYESVFRRTKDELLVRAVFIKTLHQGLHGGYTKSAGAYFKFMWEQWNVYRTYAAACAKWNHWDNQRDPKGVPTDIKQLVSLYQYDSYTRIASCLGFPLPQVEQESLAATSAGQGLTSPMSREEAEELAEALRHYASWYLLGPQLYPDTAHGPHACVVGALWLDGQERIFTTFDEWLALHHQMLLLPEEIAAWFEAERVGHLQEGRSEDGLTAQEREDCVHAALAMFAYYGRNATSLSWEELVILGIPLMGKRAESALEEAVPVEQASIVVEEGQLYVRLDDGDLVPVDEYQRAFAACEEEERQEEQASTVEGMLAALQAELLLGLHIAVLRTCGLSRYRKLVANGELQPERVATSETREAAEETLAADGPGTDRQAAEALCKASIGLYLQRISNALDTRLYRVMWKLRGSGDGCAIEIESLLTGTVFTYESQGQVDELLAELRAQQGGEEAAVASYT